MYSNEIILFKSGGRSHYRIPSIVATNDGTIFAFCNDRKDSVIDHAKEVALVYARKKNNQPWEPEQTLSGIPDWACGIGSAIYDPDTDVVFVSGSRNPVARNEFGTFTDEEIAAMEAEAEEKARALGISRGEILFESADGGDSWQDAPIQIKTRKFTTTDGRTLEIGGSCHGSAHGIQLKHGPHKGRLLWPSRIFTNRYTNWAEAILACYNNSLYSDDHGKTWHASAPVQQGTGEGTLIEDENGVIHYNSRGMHCDQKRYLATSYDCGETYQDFRTDDFLIEEKEIGCNAAFFRVEKEDLPGLPQGVSSITLFSNPRDEIREKMSICYSFDNGKTWAGVKQVWEKGAAYSSLAYDKKSGHFFLLYERGPNGQAFHPYDDGISIAEFDLEWLLGQQN